MKRYITGGIAGFLIATAASAHAADVVSLVGKTIQGAFPIQIDGKPLDAPAIVVDGTSYLPVRAFGEATGYDVSFDADLGIALKKKEAPAPQPQPSPAAPATPPAAQAPGDIKAGYKAISTVILSRDGEKLKKSSGKFDIIQVNGAQYVSLITLSSFYTVSWREPLVELSLDGQTVTRVPTGTAYSKGSGAFTYDGAIYVNLSQLGLEATVSGDTLVLTEQ
ncbi:hypothetical protein SD70_18625 [Gordoniibacillus kamchatkensis]|uniref:Copper amine oxidase-like N-terminal domain-containing protein n=1 Tax=Gordoniibacillus kamchatkensis TaxID=1590651 RepID=A0ABR5AF18_9BACL|nr:hypothetical protein [Paenibacillus sp. VKM B-2647]KIL39658.1 hypothetical protein SD70_18625 [Paenibacillus sp. VKM B-2647]